jgi:hypothetical protein
MIVENGDRGDYKEPGVVRVRVRYPTDRYRAGDGMEQRIAEPRILGMEMWRMGEGESLFHLSDDEHLKYSKADFGGLSFFQIESINTTGLMDPVADMGSPRQSKLS